jgi:predicted nuclease of predicted toxin-antitoxin system
LLEIKGFPPKVVLIKTGNNSSKQLAELIINAKIKIEELKNNDYGLLEIHGPPQRRCIPREEKIPRDPS